MFAAKKAAQKHRFQTAFYLVEGLRQRRRKPVSSVRHSLRISVILTQPH